MNKYNTYLNEKKTKGRGEEKKKKRKKESVTTK